jgi:hypothetical protein
MLALGSPASPADARRWLVLRVHEGEDIGMHNVDDDAHLTAHTPCTRMLMVGGLLDMVENSHRCGLSGPDDG